MMKVFSQEHLDFTFGGLDKGMANGLGHMNVDVDMTKETKEVETMGCTDCSKVPFACSVPTLHEGLDGEE